MDIELTSEEKEKYDNVYSQITGKYSKDDLELLENDDVAKYILKNLILRYILTGEMPTDFTINYNTHLGMSNEVHYDASIPLQEKPETQVEEVIIETNETNNETNNESNEITDSDNILSSLMLDRTESDELDKPVQNE